MAESIPPTSALAKHFADFNNRQPTEADYAAIGRIALQHTSLEYQIEALVWTYFGDADKGRIATAKMGMTQRIETLKTLVEWTEPDDGIADAINWAISCFEIVRDSRNSVVHAYNFKADQSTGKLFLAKRTKSIVFDDFVQFEITPAILQQIVGKQVQISSFIYQIQRVLDLRGPKAIGPKLPAPTEPSPLPTRFAAPQKLQPQPHESPESNRRQRKSSQMLEALAAKNEKKGAQREAQKKKK